MHLLTIILPVLTTVLLFFYDHYIGIEILVILNSNLQNLTHSLLIYYILMSQSWIKNVLAIIFCLILLTIFNYNLHTWQAKNECKL